MHRKIVARLLLHVFASFVVACCLISAASAQWNEQVLYSFQGGTNDGSLPVGGVVSDSKGNLYGVLQGYGTSSCLPIGNECGAVFQLSPPAQTGQPWAETLIYTFKGETAQDGEVPGGGLIIDRQGNLYGVTAYGGTGNCILVGVQAGCGTVYELSPPKQQGGAWTETILYSFPTAQQGYVPNGNLVFDCSGNLYGATTFGGTKGTTCDEFYGGQCGVVFELSPPTTTGGEWTETVLHSFAGSTVASEFGDGANPCGGLVVASENGVVSLYGSTPNGGSEVGTCGEGSGGFVGCGTVFQLIQSTQRQEPWREKILHVFTYASDGAGPNGGLTLDSTGSLYGAAGGGGRYERGLIFRLSLARNGQWVESILYEFTGGDDGDGPHGPLRFDSKGNLLGAAIGGAYFSGVVFRLNRPSVTDSVWVYSLLYSFLGVPDGHYPANGLAIQGTHLYGETEGGGTTDNGTVFSVWR